MSPERLGESAEIRESPFERLEKEIDRLQSIVGTSKESVQGEYDAKTLEQEIHKNVGDGHIESFNELFHNNELNFRLAALQREAALQKGIDVKQVQELITANQAATYHEYFLRAVNHVTNFMREYMVFRKSVAYISPDIVEKEERMALYVKALNDALEERLAFSQVTLTNAYLAKHFGNQRALQQLHDKAMANLTEESKQALLQGDEAVRIRGNELNQRLIDLLSGQHAEPGLEKGFLPQQVTIDLLSHQYKECVEEEKALALDDQAKMQRLELKHNLAKEGQGEFTEEDKNAYDTLAEDLKGKQAKIDELRERRKTITARLVNMTDDLGDFHAVQAELSTVQNQFGEDVDLVDAGLPRPDTTPDIVRKAIDANMEERSNFHLSRMDAAVRRMDEDVLIPDLLDSTEDWWVKNGREGARKFAHTVAKLYTLPIPEAAGMKEYAYDSLTEPLDEAMGWPPGKNEWSELTPEEKKVILDRSKSLLDAKNEFDRSTIERIHETIAVAQDMPPAAQYVGMDVTEPLPSERVTQENRESLIEKYNGATVYMMVFRQLQEDWGSAEDGTGFVGQYRIFLEKVDANLDTRLDVAKALDTLSDSWFKLSHELLIGAGLLLGGGIAMSLVLKAYLTRRRNNQLERRVTEKVMKALKGEVAGLEQRLLEALKKGDEAAQQEIEGINRRLDALLEESAQEGEAEGDLSTEELERIRTQGGLASGSADVAARESAIEHGQDPNIDPDTQVDVDPKAKKK